MVAPDLVLQMWCGVSAARVFAWLGRGERGAKGIGGAHSTAVMGNPAAKLPSEVWAASGVLFE